MSDRRDARTVCMEAVELMFPTYGGGKIRDDADPLAHHLKDAPLVFAAGSVVEGVVDIVIAECRRVDALERRRRRSRKAQRKRARVERRYR